MLPLAALLPKQQRDGEPYRQCTGTKYGNAKPKIIPHRTSLVGKHRVYASRRIPFLFYEAHKQLLLLCTKQPYPRQAFEAAAHDAQTESTGFDLNQRLMTAGRVITTSIVKQEEKPMIRLAAVAFSSAHAIQPALIQQTGDVIIKARHACGGRSAHGERRLRENSCSPCGQQVRKGSDLLRR